MTKNIYTYTLGVFGLVSLCLWGRLIFFAPYLEDWDGVDLALALRRYDLSTYQPHFPGYPVYIALGHLAYRFIPSETSALILVNILFSSLTLLPLMALTYFIFSVPAAFMAGLLYLTNPLCWLESGKVLADPTGLFFVITALYFLVRAHYGTNKHPLFVGGLILGLSLGVRLDYFPFLVSLVYVSGYALLGYAGLFLGVALWLLPQLSVGGWQDFWVETNNFIIGHFSTWGGSIYSQSNLLERIRDLFWSYYANGLGGWWPDTPGYRALISVILFINIVAIYRFLHNYVSAKNREPPLASRTQIRVILLGLIPYCLWVFLGQNLVNPRHILPAIPLTIILLAGTGQRGKKMASLLNFCLFGLIGLWTIEAIQLNLIHSAQSPPQLRVVQYVKDYFPEHSTRIYCQETKRLFDFYAPYYQVKRIRSFDQLEQDLLSTYPTMSPVLLITSQKKKDINNRRLGLLQVFQNNRYIYYPGHSWYLYQLRPP